MRERSGECRGARDRDGTEQGKGRFRHWRTLLHFAEHRDSRCDLPQVAVALYGQARGAPDSAISAILVRYAVHAITGA